MSKTSTPKLVFSSNREILDISKKQSNLLNKWMVFAVFSMMNVGNMFSQYSGTISVPNATFTSLSVLIDSLNVYGLNGSLTVNVTAAQTAPVTGYGLGSVTLNNSITGTRTLTFNGNGNVITAPVGTLSTTVTGTNAAATGAIDVIWGLRGIDNTTINNFVFTDPTSNTTNITMSEAAIGLFNLTTAAGTANGCQNINLTNNTFNFQNLSTYSACIWITPYLKGGTVAATWSTISDRHRDIKINGNTMNEGYGFLAARGPSLDFKARSISMTNNTINNLGGSTLAAYGINTFQCDSVSLINNIISQDPNQTTTYYGTYFYYTAAVKANNNTVNFNRGNTTGITSYGIYCYGYNYSTEAVPTEFMFRKNDFNWITNPVVTTTTSNSYYGVSMNYPYIYNSSASTLIANKVIVDSNTIINDTIQGSGTFYGLYVYNTNNAPPNAANASKQYVQNNRIDNIVRTGFGGTNYGIYAFGASDTADIAFNIVDSFRYIYPTTSATAPSFIPFYTYCTVTGVKPFIHDNSFTNIGIVGNFTGTVGTFYNYMYGNDIRYYNNKQHNWYIRPTTAGGGTIYGLYFGSTTNNMKIYNNILDSFIIANGANTSFTGNIHGIYHPSGGNLDIYNNYIGDFMNPNGNSNLTLYGINNASTASMNIYNNTIIFGRTSALSSTNTLYGGSGIYYPNSTTAMMNLRNNIIKINATPGTSSSSFACVRRASGSSTVKPANFSGSNNTYFINTNTNNVIYGEGTTNVASMVNPFQDHSSSVAGYDQGFDGPCGLYKKFMNGEVYSVTEDNVATASAVPYVYTPTGSSLSESSGIVLPTVTTDLNGVTRGSTPDRGALQFGGTPLDVFSPSISYVDIPTIFCTTAPAFSADITDVSNVNTTASTKPRIYYKKSTETNTFAAANTSAGNGWKWVEASNSTSPFIFNIDYSLLTSTVASGDIINYFVIAQDQVATANVGANTAAFTGGCPASVNIAGTSAITGATGFKSFSVGASPLFGITYTPAVSCQGDTLTHLITMPNPTATFPNYTTSLGSNGIVSQTLFWDIDTLTIGNYSNITACTSGGNTTAINTLPASISGRYSNYTNLGIVTDIVSGTNVDWAISNSWTGISSTYPFHYAIFIDYNRNGSFELPAETVVLPATTFSQTIGVTTCVPTTAWRGSFAVPVNITSGPTLCRVMTSYNTLITAPTNNLSYGETEDYMVNLVAAPNPAVTTYAWTSNKTGATVLGTANPFKYPSLDTTTIFTSTMSISGCNFVVKDTVTVNPAPKILGANNSTQCGAKVPTCSVVDSNAYTSPTINWYATATSATPLQSGTDLTYLTSIPVTTTMYVAVQNPTTGCWSARRPITVTVLPSDSILGKANGIRDTIRVCMGVPINLTVTNAQMPSPTKSFDTFTWTCSDVISGISGPLKNTTGIQTINPVAGGNFTLIVAALDTGGAQCSAVDTIKLSVQSNPFSGGAAFLTATPNPACIGTNVTHNLFMANPAGTFPNYSTTIGINGRPTQTLYWDLDTLFINGYMNVSGCTGGGSATAINTLPASVTNVYSNYTNLGSVTTLSAGATSTWGIATSGNGITGSYAIGHALYIDYNRNGTFELPAELVGASTGTYALNTTTTCASNHGVIGSCTTPYCGTSAFTVPNNVVSGPTLMRAITMYNAVPTSPTASYSYGETEDYIVSLIGNADTNITKLSWKNNAASTPGVLGTNYLLNHANPQATTIYTVKMTNGVCIDSLKDTIVNTVAALALNPIVSVTSVCQGETIKVSVVSQGGCTPHNYNWSVASGGSFSALPGSTLNNDTVLFTPSGTSGNRTINLTVTDNVGATVTGNTVIAYTNPIPTVIVSDTICGLQQATLSATPSVSTDSIRWFSSATSYNALGSGNTFTTPFLNAQTVYWLRQFSSNIASCDPRLTTYLLQAIGPVATNGNRFVADKRVILNSVDIYPYNVSASTTSPITGSVDIGFYDNFGSEIASTGPISFPITANALATVTPITIPVGVKFDAGSYTMFLKSWTNITALDRGYQAAPPSNILPQATTSGAFRVTKGIISPTEYDYYNYYFWNYQVEEGCWGAAFPDTVKYIAPPALTISNRVDSICSGTSTTPVTITTPLTNYSNYTWTPSTNITGSAATGYVFSEPTPSTIKYVLLASQATGLQCATTDTFTLKIKPIPDAITRTPASASVDMCNGSIDQMVATSLKLSNILIGASTTTGAGTGQTPFAGGWGGTKSQFIFRASELTAAGLTAGTMKSLTFKCTASAATYEGVQIWIGHTNLTDFASGFVAMDTVNNGTSVQNITKVYEAPGALASYTPTVGLNQFDFGTSAATPLGSAVSNSFTWDGTKNIVVYFVHSENPTTSNVAASSFEYSTLGFNATCYKQNDNMSMPAMLSAPAAGVTGSTTNRPNVTFGFLDKNPITWSPTTRLFTNAATTNAYASTARDTVWTRPFDTIKYFMTATHANGCQIKDSITYNVTDTITVTSQPPTFTSYCQNDTLSLVMGATSTSPITYQWKKNGLNINGATNPSALTNNLKIVLGSLADSGTYEVSFTTGAPCGPKNSTQTIVKVRAAVNITTQPVASTVCVGTNFCVTSNGNTDSSRFWTQIGGTNTGTANSFCKTVSTYADSGLYFMTYRPFSPCRTKYSDTVRVRVLPPAIVSVDPVALTNLCIGQSTTLKATYTGALGFQWLKNGSPILGANTDSLVVTATTQADSGEYRLIVTSPGGCVNDTSSVNTGVVKVNLPVAISVQPAAKTLTCENSSSTFTVTASNNSGYQWKKNGVNVSTGTGGTTNTYQINPTILTDAGIYTVEVLGLPSCPNVTSTNDTLVVTKLAKITTQPTAFTVCENQAISITGAGSDTVSYQWLFNGSPISGATTSTYNKALATMTDSGMYRLVVIGATAGSTICKADTSTSVLGKVLRQIQITTQPLSKTQVCENSAFNASIVANNVTGYQWKKNGVNVSNGTGATTNAFSINPAAMTDAGVYTVEMTGSSPCPNVTSINDTLVMTQLAKITTQPTAQTVCKGQTLTLSTVATNASSYQWFRNGTAILGATSATYSVSSADYIDSANYYVLAYTTNGCKTDTSNTVLGAVMHEIVITTQPLSKTQVCENSAFTASVVANDALTYQWKKNGTNVSNGTGSTTNTFTINPSALSDAGVYTVEISGISPCPNKVSSNDTLVIVQLAKITTQPSAQTVCKDQTLSLSSTATNASSYQWFRNGTAISGATSSSYSVSSAQYVDSGNYYVLAYSANGCKTDTSVTVLGKVNHSIEVVTQPISSSFGCIGSPFNLNIVANNVTGYAWSKDGNPIGQTTSTMTLNPFTYSDTGVYTVTMTGIAPCPNVTSTNAKVFPTTASVITSEPVNTDVCLGNTLNLVVKANAAVSYQWKKNGVNISGAITDTLKIPNVTSADAATYSVIAIAYNGCTNDTSANAVVTISTPLSITTPLAASQVLCEGNNFNSTIAVSGTGPYTYAWTLNGSTVGTNNGTYSKTGVLVADSGKYVASVIGSTACPMIYDTLDLDVNKSPVISTQPNGTSPICLGSNMTLNTVVQNATSIEWYKTGSGTVIGTGTTYSKVSTVSDGGSYYVKAKAQPACIDLTSSTKAVTITNPASIGAHPIGAAILEDPAGSYTMNVVAQGTGPFTYQWYRQGSLIVGATSSSYFISSYVPALDSGTYYCEVRGAAPCSNLVQSNTAKITTVRCPAIKPGGQPKPMVAICAGTPFSLDVDASGAKTYQWFKDNVAISGATFPNYSIPVGTPAHSGLYRCRVFAFNDATCDITYTDTARVIIKDKPVITSQPAGIASCGASSHTMTVAATYGERYQWFRNGIAISPNGDKASYTYNNVNTIGDVFYVEVGNSLCPSANSNTVALKTMIPANQVKLPTTSAFNLVERCTDANGWTYYAPSAQSDTVMLAIKKYTNAITAKPDIEILNKIRDIVPVNVENRGAVLGGRLFNLDITGTLTVPYDVKFYYAQSEENAVMTRFRDIRSAAGSLFSSNRGDSISFIVSTQRVFNSSLWNNMTIPLNFDNTIVQTDKEFGTENGIKYVVMKKLVSAQSGGTLFMDYFLKTSSGVSNANGNGFNFSLYPIPTNDGKVTVEVNSRIMKPITFTVTDMTGRTVAVKEEKHTSLDSKHAFDFSQLANGNYQMSITNGEETTMGKFTISK